MAATFEVGRLVNGPPVMVLQAASLDHLATRVVASPIPGRQTGTALRGVNPGFVVAGESCQLGVDIASAVRRGQPGPAIQSGAHRRGLFAGL